MKSKLLFSFLFLQFFLACTSTEEGPASENDEDAARNFIQSVLDARFKEAEKFIMQDSTNSEYLAITERNFSERMTRADKAGYRDASIQIHEVKKMDDSTSIVRYSNSFKKKQDSLKVVKVGGEWLVDLKYSFPAHMLTH